MKSRARKPVVGLTAQLKLVSRMFQFMSPVKFHVAVTVLVFIAYKAAEVYSVGLLSEPVNQMKKLAVRSSPPGLWEWITAPEGDGANLRIALIYLAIAVVAKSILAWIKSVAASWQSMSMVFYMRAKIYDRLQHVGFSFHDQYSTGQLINRALSDLQSVRNFVIVSVHASLDIGLSVAGYFAMLWIQCSPRIAMAMLIPLPLWFWAIRRYAILAQPIYEKQMEASDDMVQVLTENVAGVHVVRAFGTENLERNKFKTAADTLMNRLLDAVKLRVWMSPVIRGIAASTHIGLFCYGAILVQHGEMKVGSLVSMGIAIGSILGQIQQINTISDAYQQAVVSSGRVFEILDSPDTTPQMPDAEPLRPGGGAVRFTHVSFGYEAGKEVLHDVSFSIPAGSVVALVGPTGSGKTTLASLIGRFYDPDLGKIEVDGQDLRDVTVESVRESVGYVFQETYLFSDTVARNIAYANLYAPIEKVREAAQISRAAEFIERLPEKYDSVIGEYGATLSGGQRQRLAIARAVLHNPRILVMDDALAAVDPETESLIRAGLDRIMKGRTVFLIASRIATARRANLILVIENGRITQKGSHDQLMSQPGYYREVASCQFGDVSVGHSASHMDRMQSITKKSGRVFDEV